MSLGAGADVAFLWCCCHVSVCGIPTWGRAPLGAGRATACFVGSKSATVVKWNFFNHIPEVSSLKSPLWQFRGRLKEEDEL